MAYTVVACAQRSAEWFAARAGRLTGSCAAALLEPPRKDKQERAERAKLRARLVCERLTGMPAEEQYAGPYAERGVTHECQAVAAYEAETGRIVRRTGFLAHTELPIGCSLDGHLGDPVEGILEAKCPKPETHLGYVRAGIAPPDYIPQITHNLFVSDAPWCDFVSFDDRFQDERLRLFIVRVARGEVDLAGYEAALRAFLAEVDREVQAMRTVATPAVVLAEAAEAPSVLSRFGPAFEDSPTRRELAGARLW